MSHNNIESAASTHSNPLEMGHFIMLSALVPGVLAAFALFLNRGEGHLVFRATGFPIWVLGIFSTILIPLFIFEWAWGNPASIELEGPEADELRRNEGFRIYLSRFTRNVWSILLILVLVWFFSEVAGLFLSILGTGTSSNKILTDFYAYLVALLPLMTLAAFVALLLQIFKHRIAAMAVGAFLYILFRSLVYIKNPLGSLNPALYMDWHLKWLDPLANWASLWQAAAYLTTLFLAFFILGYLLFARKG